MSAREFADLLQQLVDGAIDHPDEVEDLIEDVGALEGARTDSYANGAWLTSNDGFVVKLSDGSEMHITVKDQ